MLVRIVQLHIQEAHIEHFLKLYAAHQQMISTNEGCISLNLLQQDGHPDQVATLSHWKSEHYLNQYRNSAFFKTLWTQVKPLFASPAKAFSYQIWNEQTESNGR
jgi:quinol monooxygenase YgiN